MNREEIEWCFVGASWEVYESSSPHLLLVGNADDLSMVAYRSLAEAKTPHSSWSTAGGA